MQIHTILLYISHLFLSLPIAITIASRSKLKLGIKSFVINVLLYVGIGVISKSITLLYIQFNYVSSTSPMNK